MFLEHELDGMVAGLLHLKQNVEQKSLSVFIGESYWVSKLMSYSID